jgi:cyanate permease
MTMLRITPRSDWPFSVSRSPFFYGWVIWGISTLGFLMSVPGQTMGMAVFTDKFIETLGLSRTQLAMAYFFGTVGSALFLTRAGRYYDQFGARTMIVISSIALGVVVGLISVMDYLSNWFAALLDAPLAWVSFPLILLGYFGVRFSGQGVLTSASRNVLLFWFEKRRGLVSGIRGVFVSLGFSIAPLVIAMMIATFGWRGALWSMAAAVGILFALLALILVRDSPEACGLLPDGAHADDPVDEDVAPDIAATVAQARVDPIFWIHAMGLAIHALFGTAVTFHIVSIFNEAGRTSEEAFGYFLPSAIVSLSVNLFASWLADFSPLKPFLIIMLCAFSVAAIGLINLQTDTGYWMLVAGFGAGGGLWGVLSNLAFVRYFGRKHLGEISGLNMSITVFASAIGPVLFSVARDFSGNYQSAEMLCAIMIVGLIIAAIIVPDRRPASR